MSSLPKKSEDREREAFRCVSLYAHILDEIVGLWVVAQLFRVLDLAHEATLSDVPTTKR